ncbi:hypothetical protein J4573_49300 [Actinomadura barringtoniae]|uniref:DUF6545 domain-containing protein n=1 Tax=Actinomadura barringtoniae TaxID=1427535 RepID=A0A939PM51_9ACTN|nr:MAB_1171c family putative transporter [Actinomadura barringtoniae]MBO2455160.1 hypothetical protein [Actinomadura barringtoniae]
MVDNLPYLFIALLAFTAFVRKVSQLWRPGRPEALPALCAALGALTLATLLFAPSIREFIDRTSQLPGFARWAANSFGIMTSCALQIMTMRFIHGAKPGVRSRQVVAVVTVVAMGLLLLPQRLPDGPEFVTEYATNPAVAVYFMLTTAYVLVVASDLAQLTFRYSRHTRMRYLRLGMQLVGWGAILAIAYAAYREATVIAGLMGEDLPGDEQVITQVLAVPGGVLTVLGASLATWGPGMLAPFQRMRQRRAVRRLRPMWQALTEVVPDVVLDTTGEFSKDPAAQLHRYLVEINDALLILAPYRLRDNDSRPAASRGEAERITAAQEARLLLGAIQRYRAGDIPANDETGTGGPVRSTDEEVQWFGLVADELTARRRRGQPTGPAAISRP